jgi:hypothetical protein
LTIGQDYADRLKESFRTIDHAEASLMNASRFIDINILLYSISSARAAPSPQGAGAYV